jgi:hypothetical protein
VGSATNSSALQVGGALGVAVIGSVLAVRYQADMASVLVGHNVPPVASSAILGSVGGALAVAHAAGGALGAELAVTARHAYVSGMDLSLKVAAVVAAASTVLVLAALPARARPTQGLDGELLEPSVVAAAAPCRSSQDEVPVRVPSRDPAP